VNINCEEQRTGSARGRRQERRQAVAGEQRIGRRFDGPDALIDDPEDHASLRYGLCHRGSRSHARLGDRCLQGDRYGNGTQSTRPCSRGSLRLTSPTTSTISTVVFPAPADRRRSLMAAIVSTLFVPSLPLADKDGGGGRDFSATNAGCTEAIGFGPIPAAQAQPFVPTGFVVAPVGPGSARLGPWRKSEWRRCGSTRGDFREQDWGDALPAGIATNYGRIASRRGVLATDDSAYINFAYRSKKMRCSTQPIQRRRTKGKRGCF